MTDPSSQRTGCAETNPFCVDEVPSNDELAADCCTTVTSKRYSLWSKTTPCQAVFISPRKSQTNNAPFQVDLGSRGGRPFSANRNQKGASFDAVPRRRLCFMRSW